MKEMKVVCERCGSIAPIDEEKSNENWKVYSTKEPCKCGGRFVPEIIAKQNKGGRENE